MSHRALTELAQSKYRRRDGQKKVPGWILSFAKQSLSQNPPLLASAIVYCLSIVAIDLGCNFSSARAHYGCVLWFRSVELDLSPRGDID